MFGSLFTAKQKEHILMRMVHGLYDEELLELSESHEGPLE